MAHYEKYSKLLGILDRPNVDSAPQLSVDMGMWGSVYQDPNTNQIGSVQIAPGTLTPESIEDAFLKLAAKYGLKLSKEDKPMNMSEAFQGCSHLSDALGCFDDSLPKTKTFTLDEIINLIEGMHTESIDKGQPYWNTQDIRQYIDKNELIHILKNQ